MHTGITGTTSTFFGRPYRVYPTEHLHPLRWWSSLTMRYNMPQIVCTTVIGGILHCDMQYVHNSIYSSDTGQSSLWATLLTYLVLVVVWQYLIGSHALMRCPPLRKVQANLDLLGRSTIICMTFRKVVVVVYPLHWPLLLGGVRSSRFWSHSQLIPLSGQQLHHPSGVCPQSQGWQCGAYVGAFEEMMCVVCVDVTEGT